MQYFENDENLGHSYADFGYCFGSSTYTFRTDAGTFSHGHVDSGSALLMSAMKNLKGSFLDLGCGCGCIGIIMAKEYGLELVQSDVNERAATLAGYNREVNGVEGETVISDCYENLKGRKFDTIALNPPIHAGKDVMYRMYSEAPEHLNDGGRMYVVILKKHGADSTRKKLTEVFGNCEILCKQDGCFVFMCTKQ